MTKIQIDHIQTAAQAQAAIAAKADAISLIFIPNHPHYIANEEQRQIIDGFRRIRPPRRVKTIGVIADQHPKVTHNLYNGLGVNAVQLDGQETPDYCRQAKAEYRVDLVKTITVHPFEGLPNLEALLQEYLSAGCRLRLDCAAADPSSPPNWNTLAALAQKGYVFTLGGLTPENAAAAIQQVQPWGVALAADRTADPEQVRQFIANARAAQQT